MLFRVNLIRIIITDVIKGVFRRNPFFALFADELKYCSCFCEKCTLSEREQCCYCNSAPLTNLYKMQYNHNRYNYIVGGLYYG